MASKQRVHARSRRRSRGRRVTLQAPGHARWGARSIRQQHIVCALMLATVAIIFSAPTLFSGQSLIGGDTVHWRAAAQSLFEHRESTGEEPLWSTHVFGGMPGHVISPPPFTPQIDEIPRLLRRLSWPLSHVLTLLAGAYALTWYITRNTLGALLAACAYGLTTYLPVILVAGHNSKFVALAYAPWLLLAFVYSLRRPGVVASLLFAIALAANLQAGHIQVTYYIAFIAGVWWIVECTQAVTNGQWRKCLATTAGLAAGTLLAVVMVSEVYWPAWEYKAYSIRGMSSGGDVGGLSWEYAMSWSQGQLELLTLLIADALGGSALYWGPKVFTGGPHYVGGVVILLAALALWQIRSRSVCALGICLVLMILFSLGENLEVVNRLMFNYFPLFDAFRVPETWLIAVALVLAILAAMGLTWLTDAPADGANARAALKAWSAITGLALLLWIAAPNVLSFEKDFESARLVSLVAQQTGRPTSDPQVTAFVNERIEEELVTPRRDAYQRDAGRTLIYLLLAGGLLLLYRRKSIPAWVMQAGLVVLVVLDLGSVARRYLNEDRLVPTDTPEALVQTLDVDRFIVNQEGQFRVLSLENLDQTRLARPSYHHESLGGYSGAKLRLYQDFLENMLMDASTGLPNENALDMMNTRYVIHGGAVPGTRLAFEGTDSGLSVYENPDVRPRAWLVGEVEVIESASETWSRLQSADFDPAVLAVVTHPLETSPAPIDSSSIASVAIAEYGPRQITYRVDSDAPRLLVLSEVYYPAGWTATLNDQIVPIIRANYLLRAIEIPGGTSNVVLSFDPRSYVLGRWISRVSTLLVYGWLLFLLVQSYRRRTVSKS